MTLSNSDPARFFIALMLAPEVEAYASGVIAELRKRYRTSTAKAAPHITLQPPFLWATNTNSISKLAQQIEAIAARQAPVPICLNGFSAFEPRVLYINVEKTEALLTLQAQIARHLSAHCSISDPKAKSRSFSPHVTVASRNLSPALFRRAWDDLQSRPVHFEFVCDRLTLLVYRTQWDIHTEYSLRVAPGLNKPVT